MEDDEAEMARLRQSKRHQAFEKKFDRAGARMIKQIHLKQANEANESPLIPTPTPSSPSSPSQSKSKQSKKRKLEELELDELNDNTPHILTEEDIKNLPTSFGKQQLSPQSQHKSNNKGTDNKTKTDFSEDFKSDNDDNDNDENEDDDICLNKKNKKFEKSTKKYFEHILSEYNIPMRYVAKLKGHNKLISTMCIDRSGTRLITGCYDNTVKFWDFGGMNEKLESFRSITPCDGYPIKSLEYNYSGSMFICCTGSHKPLIYDRDGHQLIEFRSGDMYIRDMQHTFGHTMPLMGGKWFGINHLNQNMNEIATWSQDSTFRIWDINQENKNCKQIIKARNKTGKRISVTSANFNNTIYGINSFLIILGCNDGSIQIFDHKSHCKRPKKIIENAHIKGTDISHIQFDKLDNNIFLSRGGKHDNSLKIWDIRNISHGKPIKILENMWNVTSLSNIIQSPDGKTFITSCSNQKQLKNDGTGQFKKNWIGKSTLCVIDRSQYVEMIRIPISDKPINNVLWHNKINQLFVAGNDSNIRVFYNDEPKSRNGVLLCAQRRYKKKHIDEQMRYFKIINPNALRVYKKHNEILQEKRKKDLLLHKPEMPHYGIGVQGRINTESFTHSVYKSQEKNIMSQVDPRDRLLLFNEKAIQNQQFTAIYNINQPIPVFQEKDQQEIEANNIVNKLYTDMPGARQYNPLTANTAKSTKEPPKKKQKI